MASYDPGYKPPKWWLDKAEAIIKANWDGRRDELAKRAKDASGTDKNWDGTRITKWLGGANGTLKLAIGVARVIGLPPPVFEARSWPEADALQQRAKSFDPVEKPNPDPVPKITQVAQTLESAIEAARDQTQPLRSRNEGSPRGLGHRRASTRR
jgi:hypothetical protein